MIIGQPTVLDFTTTKVDIPCNGESTGSITINASGGTALYQFSKNGGISYISATSPFTFTNLTTDTYNIALKDANNCTVSNAVTISQPATLLAAIISAQTNISCNGGADGSATVSASGGTPAYTYLWSNGQTSATSINLSAGTYNVTIKDVNLCTKTASVIITNPTLLTVSITAQTNVLCNGGNNGSLTTTPVGGSPPYTYLWSNGQSTQTATNLIAGPYTVLITDSKGCTKTSNSVTVIQPSLLLASSAVTTPISCFGGNATITVTVNQGTSPYSGTGTFVRTAGTYTFTVTDANGCTANTTIIVTQPQQISILVNSNSPLCSGSTLNLTSTPNGGTTPYIFSWTSQNGGFTSTLQNPSITNITNAYTGNITVSVSDKNGCSAAAVISVNITNIPNPPSTTGIIICNVTSGSVSASGKSGLEDYKWYDALTGGSLLQTNGNTYTTPILSTTTTYFASIYNIVLGCESSRTPVTATVYPNLTSGTIGSTQTICYNTTPDALTEISTATGGAGLYTYKWQSSPTGGLPWTDIPGATSGAYSPGMLTTTTWYRRSVTSGTCVTVYNNSIQIIVHPNFTAGSIGSDQTICYNTSPAAFTQTLPAGGDGIYSYQWQSSPTGGEPFTDIAGATSNTYNPGILTSTLWYRRSVVSGSCGTLYTPSIKITVYNDLLYGSIGSNQTVCYNATPAPLTELTPATGGSGVYTYQWYRSSDNITFTAIAGATLSNYSPDALTSTTYFSRVVISSLCSSTPVTASVTITVYPDLNAGSVGTIQTICYNTLPASLIEMSASEGGTGSYNYQWQSSPDNTTWTNIPGANMKNYSPGLLAFTTWFRRTVVAGSCSPVYSSSIQIIVQSQLLPGTITGNQTVCNGGDPLQLTNTDGGSGGTGTVTYRWESFSGAGPWTTIAGATSFSYDPTALHVVTTQYRRIRIVTQFGVSCESSASNILTVSVQAVVNAGSISSAQTICEGDVTTAFTSVAASGGNPPLAYQWQNSSDGTTFSDLPGAPNETYNAGILTSDAWFQRIVISTLNGRNCKAISNNLKITVNNIFSAGTIGTDQELCLGDVPTAFTSVALPAGDGTFTYQWQKSIISASGGFSDIAGATGITYSPATPAVTTWYRRMAVSALSGIVCSAASNAAEITIGNFDAGTISAFVNDLIFCEGENPGIITGTNVSYSAPINFQGYQWQSSTDAISYSNIPGATIANYDPPVISVNIWYRRIVNVKIKSKLCSAPGNLLALKVYPVPSLTVTTPLSICKGNPVTITATATNTSGTPSYTLAYVSGTYITAPAVQTNTTGIFIVNPPASPEFPPVGIQNFSVTITNGDAGLCNVTKPVVIEIFDIPNITMTPSCSSGLDGTIEMTGTVSYPVGAVVQYSLNGGPWTTNKIFSGQPTGLFYIDARNSSNPACTVQLSGEILGKTIETLDFHICQNGTLSDGLGLQATSYCISWTGGAHNLNGCTSPSTTYVVSSRTKPYLAGSLVQYGEILTFKPTPGSITIKDCPAISGTYSVYKYPFNPQNPAQNFIEWIPSSCPGGTGTTISGLDPNTVYVLVLNSLNTTNSVCSQIKLTTGDKVQYATAISNVYWYTSPTAVTSISTGTTFNPLTTVGSGITNTSTPGTYTFYTGCASGPCREPVSFVVDPLPILVASNQTICSGKTINLQLSSKDNLNRVIDPAAVTYQWTASPTTGTASGYSNCLSSCGSIINQTLAAISSCPVIRYQITANVNGCYGLTYPVDVLIVDSPLASHPAPAIPADITYTCLSLVPAPQTINLLHSCLPNMSATGVDADLGGTGCTGSPHVIKRTWTFVDACETTVATQTITIIDNMPPTFTRPADKTIYTDASCNYSVHPSVTGEVTIFSDNCSTGLMPTYTDSEVITCQGTKIVMRTWHLMDNCGNAAANQVQTITIKDNIKPTYTRPPDKTIYSDVSCNYNSSLALTGDVTDEHDNCTTGLQASFTDVINNNQCNILITRTWHLVDNCGNAAADQVQTITVKDNLPPTFTRPVNINIYTDVSCGYNASVSSTGDVTNEADNCSSGLQATYTDVTANGACEGSKVISRTWHLVDNCGNAAADQVQTIIVLDNTSPTFTRPADITVYRNGTCAYNASLIITGDVINENDNCSTGINAIYADVTTVINACVTEIKRTWSLTDKCGNVAVPQIQTITITDNSPPILANPADKSYCVEDIHQADFDLPTIDISPIRPDWYTLPAGSNDLDLNPLFSFSDNCTAKNSLILNWRIDFTATIPAATVPFITGTGQPSTYGSAIIFLGDPINFNDVVHFITYWITDQCGNESLHKVASLVIKPRPDVIKQTF